MSGDGIFLGVILVVLGAAGLFVKIERYRLTRQSYTGHPLRWGPYIIITAGILIIIRELS